MREANKPFPISINGKAKKACHYDEKTSASEEYEREKISERFDEIRLCSQETILRR